MLSRNSKKRRKTGGDGALEGEEVQMERPQRYSATSGVEQQPFNKRTWSVPEETDEAPAGKKRGSKKGKKRGERIPIPDIIPQEVAVGQNVVQLTGTIRKNSSVMSVGMDTLSLKVKKTTSRNLVALCWSGWTAAVTVVSVVKNCHGM